MLAAFILWTMVICTVDVQAIGPEGSCVGLAAMNGAFYAFTGVHMALYTATDWLSLVPLSFAAGFGLLGLLQWIGRKSLCSVDRSILTLGGLYLSVMAAYIFFENCVVNYRPVLIEGILEASYPSSTTVLVLCVMPAAVMQLDTRMKKGVFRRCVMTILVAFTALMVIGRLISGVHWLSDVVGGMLLSGGLVMIYSGVYKKE